MGAGAQRHILATQPSQLGDAQTCLDRDKEDHMVASPDPCGCVGSTEEGPDFLIVKELDDTAFEALARDREYALTMEGIGGFRKGNVTEEGAQRRKAGVAAASAVATFPLEVIQELAEEIGVE